MNIKKMMREAAQMQEKLQKEVAAIEVEGTSGGGMVTVRMNGSKQILDVRLDPSTVDPQEREMLEDLIVAAAADASRRVDEVVQEKVGGALGGLGGAIPGLGNLLG